MKGKIALRGMLFHSFHGVHQFERERGNDFRIDLVFEADLSRAAMSDNLSDTLDYEEVYRVVSDVMQTPVNLLEHLAYKISEALLQRFAVVDTVEVVAAKLSPPLDGQCEESSVSLVRHR